MNIDTMKKKMLIIGYYNIKIYNISEKYRIKLILSHRSFKRKEKVTARRLNCHSKIFEIFN